MNNIYFIEAKSPGAHIFSRTPLPRLGSVLLATILKNKGYNTRVFIEDISMPDWDLMKDADIICVSSITSTAPRAYQVADMFTSKGIPVIMGGAHSTFLPEESLLHADYVVRGEGEETIVELIDHLKENRPLNSIRGLSFRNEQGGIRHNPDRELISDLDLSPSPDFSLVYKWKKPKVVPVATSRGCPYACRFCSVVPMFGRKYRFKSVSKVIEELRAVASEKTHVFFVDDNFAANKGRTKALLRAMADSGIRLKWSAQMRTDIAKDPELIKLMADSGCFSVFVGFESINPGTLELFNKKQAVEDITECIRMLKNHSINIHGMFVLGSDTDDIQTIRNTRKYANEFNINSVQFMMLTPLPGTPIFKEFTDNGRIIHTDWSKYDAHHAVFEPKLMTAFELHVETLKAMSKFYSWRSILLNLWKFDFFYGFVRLYGKRSVRKALSNRKKYLDNIKELIIEEFDKNTNRLRRYFYRKKRACRRVVLNTVSLEKTESRFFSIFLKKLDKNLIIAKERIEILEDTIIIAPFAERLQTGFDKGKQYVSDFYRSYRNRLDSIRIIDMESLSLYKTCVNLGLLLNVNSRKIRKAYEKALKDIDGNVFECNHILILAG